MRERASWQIHPTLASDHYAVSINLQLQKIPPPPPVSPRWNQERANWNKFSEYLEAWHKDYEPPEDINQLALDIEKAFHTAADIAMPKTKAAKQQYKDSWYYCQEVKALKQRVNRTRKIYRKRPRDANRIVLQEVIKDVHREISEIKTNKWLQWCSRLNQHSSLKELWQWLKRVAGKKKTKPRTHQSPKEEAERLATNFASRSSSNQLPPDTLQSQVQLQEE